MNEELMIIQKTLKDRVQETLSYVYEGFPVEVLAILTKEQYKYFTDLAEGYKLGMNKSLSASFIRYICMKFDRALLQGEYKLVIWSKQGYNYCYIDVIYDNDSPQIYLKTGSPLVCNNKNILMSQLNDSDDITEELNIKTRDFKNTVLDAVSSRHKDWKDIHILTYNDYLKIEKYFDSFGPIHIKTNSRVGNRLFTSWFWNGIARVSNKIKNGECILVAADTENTNKKSTHYCLICVSPATGKYLPSVMCTFIKKSVLDSLLGEEEPVTESLIKDEHKQHILSILKDKYDIHDKYIGTSMYLLPDGTYLDVGDAHCNVEEVLQQFLVDNGYIKEEDGYIVNDMPNNYLEEELGFIHCGNDSWNYLGISNKIEPTTQQYSSLKSYDDYHIQNEVGYVIEVYGLDTHKETVVYYDNEEGCLVDRYNRKTSAESKIRTYHNTGSFRIVEELDVSTSNIRYPVDDMTELLNGPVVLSYKCKKELMSVMDIFCNLEYKKPSEVLQPYIDKIWKLVRERSYDTPYVLLICEDDKDPDTSYDDGVAYSCGIESYFISQCPSMICEELDVKQADTNPLLEKGVVISYDDMERLNDRVGHQFLDLTKTYILTRDFNDVENDYEWAIVDAEGNPKEIFTDDFLSRILTDSMEEYYLQFDPITYDMLYGHPDEWLDIMIDAIEDNTREENNNVEEELEIKTENWPENAVVVHFRNESKVEEAEKCPFNVIVQNEDKRYLFVSEDDYTNGLYADNLWYIESTDLINNYTKDNCKKICDIHSVEDLINFAKTHYLNDNQNSSSLFDIWEYMENIEYVNGNMPIILMGGDNSTIIFGKHDLYFIPRYSDLEFLGYTLTEELDVSMSSNDNYTETNLLRKYIEGWAECLTKDDVTIILEPAYKSNDLYPSCMFVINKDGTVSYYLILEWEENDELKELADKKDVDSLKEYISTSNDVITNTYKDIEDCINSVMHGYWGWESFDEFMSGGNI